MLPTPIVAPAAGVATGVACSLVRVLLSVAKSRVQLGLAPSAGAALRQAYATGGAAALYTGFGATLALDVRRRRRPVHGARRGPAPPRHQELGGAGLRGLGALDPACTEPVDVVRTRIMAQLRRGDGAKAKGTDFNCRSRTAPQGRGRGRISGALPGPPPPLLPQGRRRDLVLDVRVLPRGARRARRGPQIVYSVKI